MGGKQGLLLYRNRSRCSLGTKRFRTCSNEKWMCVFIGQSSKFLPVSQSVFFCLVPNKHDPDAGQVKQTQHTPHRALEDINTICLVPFQSSVKQKNCYALNKTFMKKIISSHKCFQLHSHGFVPLGGGNFLFSFGDSFERAIVCEKKGVLIHVSPNDSTKSETLVKHSGNT